MKLPAIMITEPIAPSAVDYLRQKGYPIQTEYGQPNPDVAPADIQAVINRTRPIDRAWMDLYPNLKIIAYHGVGIDGIDLETAKERGIYVTITPGQNSLAVAEHAIALMFALSKQIVPLASRYGKEGFDCKYGLTYSELTGKTLGLIGLGNIGLRVARMARDGFGMKVLAYTRTLKEAEAGIEVVSREEIFRRADYVSLHLPMNPQTHHSVGKAEFELMKPTAFLINTARGGIVDQDALIAALQSGQIAGAGLDVTDPEHCPVDNPLLHMDNVVVTPHVAASSDEALIRVANMCIDGIEKVFRGEEPDCRVV